MLFMNKKKRELSFRFIWFSEVFDYLITQMYAQKPTPDGVST